MLEGPTTANATGLSAAGIAEFRALEEVLAADLATLADKPEENAGATLAALWCAAIGKAVSVQLASAIALRDLAPDELQRLRGLIGQRLDGMPLAHITGRQHFMGLEMLAGPEALIPRQETMLLGYAARGKLEALSTAVTDRDICVIDVCTGSGNLALALAHGNPRARVWAADLSTDAVRLAERNAAALQLQDRIALRAGDLLAPFESPEFLGKVDLLVCNPPYISTAKVVEMPDEISQFEPHLAFDGGPLGIRILVRLITDAPRFLRDGGWLAFEVGLGQARGVRRKLEQAGIFVDIEEVLDREGNARALVARVASRK
jgi:release factor glutamine methyltransferase